MFLQVALVFAVIGALGLVLKWAFSRDKEAPTWPADSPSHGQPTWSALTGWSHRGSASGRRDADERTPADRRTWCGQRSPRTTVC